jgi:hypothetical protein
VSARPCVSTDAHDDVDAFGGNLARVGQHCIGLADACARAEEDLQLAGARARLLALDFLQQFVGIGTLLGHRANDARQALSASTLQSFPGRCRRGYRRRANPYEFFIPSPAVFSARLHRKSHYFTHAKIRSGEGDMDLLYVGLIVGFVAISCALTFYLERLRSRDELDVRR